MMILPQRTQSTQSSEGFLFEDYLLGDLCDLCGEISESGLSGGKFAQAEKIFKHRSAK